jgi:rhodanese-related sulfurtransferase
MSHWISAAEVRSALLTRQEIALLDLREEAQFASAHPLFAAQLPADRIALEAPVRIPRRDTLVVLYAGDTSEAENAKEQLRGLGYTEVYLLQGGLDAWRAAGFELFQDVNSYSKAFGELVEARRHTPSLSSEEVATLIEQQADIAIVDARRFDEYATMSIPTGTSVPGAELVLRVPVIAPGPETTVVVNCAGRTRSIIGAQSLINAGLPNRVVALRNGTMGWKLAGQKLESGQRRAPDVSPKLVAEARQRAHSVAYRAGVRHITAAELAALVSDSRRTLYLFDVRTPEEYRAGHLPAFHNAPGGQLVQETDYFAPVRGARIVLADDLGARADMTASWLAQMAWEVYVLDSALEDRVAGAGSHSLSPRSNQGRYKRPYEGTDASPAAMRAYLEWEFGLVEQLERDHSHGFFVI